MWNFFNPVKLVFGIDALDRIGELVRGRPYGLVTYGDPFFSELTERISQLAGTPGIVINDVSPNPGFGSLAVSCDRLASNGRSPEIIVAVGGGSAIDTGKVLAASGGGFSRVRECLETGEGCERLKPLPLIAIPTTAGTGSEVTRFATVWDHLGKKKYSLALDSSYPEYALVDPVLSQQAPRDLTISTGVDALSHALESIWNVNANPISSHLCVFAAKEVLLALPLLSKNLDNLDLRLRMARAATMAGLGMSNTQTALAHTLSYPFTLNYGVPHGIACSFCLPMVMQRAIGSNPECDSTLEKIFGTDLEAGVEQLSDFLLDLGISTSPEDYGMEKKEWSALVQTAIGSGLGKNFVGRDVTPAT